MGDLYENIINRKSTNEDSNEKIMKAYLKVIGDEVVFESNDKIMDKKMLKKGKNYKIILPKGKGEPLYTDSFNAAKEMAKEYGKGTRVVDLSKK